MLLIEAALVYGQMNEPPGARARVALTGLTVAEYFRDEEGQARRMTFGCCIATEAIGVWMIHGINGINGIINQYQPLIISDW